MDTAGRIGRVRQFSVRSLLLVVTASGALFAAARLFGIPGIVGGSFCAVSAIPLWALPGSWKRAYSLAWASAYLPFVAMAGYALAYVSCSNCKKAACEIVPFGPGLMPVELVRHTFGLGRPADTVLFVASVFITAALVAILTWALRTRARGMGAVVAIATAGYCTFAAVVILAMIRM